jgi:arylsulfatase
MPEALRQAGYQTHYCGKPHLRTSLTPKGLPLDQVEIHEFPEARDLWNSGRINSLPTPYYGFEEVRFVNGHAHGSWGEYVNWLNHEHPSQAHLCHDRVTLEPPSPAADLYTASFKWALPFELHPMTWTCDRTIEYLNLYGTQKRTAELREGDAKPFLLWCSIADPHVPLAPTAPYCYRYDPDEIPPANRREGEFDDLPPHIGRIHAHPKRGINIDPHRGECTAHYYGLIEMIDDSIGRVLHALRENELEQDTVVIVAADHGEALGDHGMWGKGPYHFDSVIRVPLVVRWPGRIRESAIHTGVVSLLDFAPTILDLAGVPIPEGHRPPHPVGATEFPPWPGRSLVPLLIGAEERTAGSALVEDDQDDLEVRLRTLVTHRYRLTTYAGQDYGELFDLQEDPHELYNLWHDPSQKKRRDELQLTLLDKIITTDHVLPRRMVSS